MPSDADYRQAIAKLEKNQGDFSKLTPNEQHYAREAMNHSTMDYAQNAAKKVDGKIRW